MPKKTCGFSYASVFFADIIGRDEVYILNIESDSGSRLPAGGQQEVTGRHDY